MPADVTNDDASTVDEHHESDEAQFAVLLALVPAMAMTFFNMAGLL